MLRRTVLLAPLALLPLVSFAFVQERVKPKAADDFPKCLETAQKAWHEERYGECLRQLQNATGLAATKRVEAIKASLPAAPAGYKIAPEKNTANQANPFVGAVTAGLGSVVTQRYNPIERGGGQAINVTVTADSPLLQMFRMWVANPAMLPAGSELIKYGAHNAVLKKEQGGQKRNLQILIGNSLVDVNWPNADEDALLAMWNQAAVDKLDRTLNR